MAGIEQRISALAAAVRRREFDRAGPVDGLSASMFELEDELLSLDIPGKALLLAELNKEIPDDESGAVGLTPQGLDAWIESVRENRKFLW